MNAVLDFPTLPVEPMPEVASDVVDRAEISAGKVLVKYSQTEAGLAALKTDLAGKTYDLKTVKGNDAARGDRLRCVTLRTTLEKKRKAFKAPAIEFGKLIDAEAARITAEIEALELPIDEQIRADEARRAAEKAERDRIEAERVAGHQAFIATIHAYLTHCQRPDMTAARIAAGIGALGQLTIGKEREEFEARALAAQVETLQGMQTLHAQAVARDAEAARQEAIRIENERVAKELAAERERIAAQAAEVRREQEALAAQRAESERLEKLAEERRAATARAEAQALAAAAVGVVAAPGQCPPPEYPAPQFDAYLPASTVTPPLLEPAEAPTTVTLGSICAELGFDITQAFVSQLGIDSVGRLKRAVLYTAAQRKAIFVALVMHIQSVA